MTRDRDMSPAPDGTERSTPARLTLGERALLVMAFLWVAGWTAALASRPGIGWLDALLTWTVIVLPAGLVWLGIRMAQLRRLLLASERREKALAEAASRIRADPRQPARTEDRDTGSRVADRIAALAEAMKRNEARLDALVALVERGHLVPANARSPSEAVLPPAAPRADTGAPQSGVESPAADMVESPPLSTGDLVSALQFPADSDDVEGFRALRRALRDRRTGQLVTAAQDVLTLLSQDGLYMDDLAPQPTSPGIWRRFAAGERGEEIASLGGVHNAEAIDAIAARMRQDTIFHDTVHHFLRHFDRVFAEVAPEIADADIAALAETRTARAFRLLGRVAGTFD